MINILKKLHLYGTYRRVCFFLVNCVFRSTKPLACSAKRFLLNRVGCQIGEGTTIVSPISIFGTVSIGRNCWINRGFTVHGNGCVTIGDNCDIAPDVSILTGGHQIGQLTRRAGKGELYQITIGDGCWIGSRATLLGNINVGEGAVIAACACVIETVPSNTLVAGIPAKKIKELCNEKT